LGEEIHWRPRKARKEQRLFPLHKRAVGSFQPCGWLFKQEKQKGSTVLFELEKIQGVMQERRFLCWKGGYWHSGWWLGRFFGWELLACPRVSGNV
jgi:hypothetical protein